ncbi:MAG: 6-phosphofructokinase [Bacteroidota bacterium]
MKPSIAILAGGGPAPGINNIISLVTKTFLKSGYSVLGLHGAYKSLFADDPKFENLTFEFADRIFNKGGSALTMSRFKPRDSDIRPDFFIEHNVKLLVTIGGDDTASTANRITKYLQSQRIDIANIHVPKTIDNDLPLPEGTPTFGYYSAKQTGIKIASTIYEDARTTNAWFIMSAMGREAGHLAFGIGSACHFPMIIIPEIFTNTKLTFDKVTRMVVSSMIKRKILGIDYGVAIISEGVFHFMDQNEIASAGIQFTYDAHGHPELGNISKAHIFNMHVGKELQRAGMKIKSRPVETGYELRCAKPVGYDLGYCTNLGIGVKILFDQGFTGCMVTADQKGQVAPLFLKDVEDEEGRIKPRLVNIKSDQVKNIFEYNLHFITEDDYEEARQYVDDPERYNFFKILEWDRMLAH